MSNIKLLSLFVILTLAGCSGTMSPMTQQQKADTLYAKASELHEAGLYDEASVHFEEYVKQYPERNSADNAKLKIANGYFQQKEYDKAIEVYQEIAEMYPGGDAADWAMLYIGDVYFAQEKMNEAIGAYEKLLLKYPRFRTRVAASAQRRVTAIEDIEEDMRIISEGDEGQRDNAQFDIANIYFEVFGDCASALEEFHKIVDTWPESELADDALWKIGECYWNIATQELPSRNIPDEQKAYIDLIEIYDRYPQLKGIDLFRLDVHWPAGKRGDSYELSYAQVRRIVNKYPGIKEKRTIDYLPENYKNAFQTWFDVIRMYPNTDTAVAGPESIALALVDVGNLYYNMGMKHFGCILFRGSLMVMPTTVGHLGMARYYANITSTSGLPWAYRRAFYHIKEAEKLTPPDSGMANEVSWAKEWMNYKMRIEALESWPERQ